MKKLLIVLILLIAVLAYLCVDIQFAPKEAQVAVVEEAKVIPVTPTATTTPSHIEPSMWLSIQKNPVEFHRVIKVERNNDGSILWGISNTSIELPLGNGFLPIFNDENIWENPKLTELITQELLGQKITSGIAEKMFFGNIEGYLINIVFSEGATPPNFTPIEEVPTEYQFVGLIPSDSFTIVSEDGSNTSSANPILIASSSLHLVNDVPSSNREPIRKWVEFNPEVTIPAGFVGSFLDATLASHTWEDYTNDGYGVCFMSARWHENAIAAGLPVFESHKHSNLQHETTWPKLTPSAAVFVDTGGNRQDFRFQNNTGKTLKIVTSLENDIVSVYFYVYGEANRISWMPSTVLRWSELIAEKVEDYSTDECVIDQDLVAVMMLVESCGNPLVGSSAGAKGLMQVMGFNATKDEDLLDPSDNMDASLRYIVEMWNKFRDWNDVIKSYNGGPGAVTGGMASETRRYYRWVSGMWGEVNNPTSEFFRDWWEAGGSRLCKNALIAPGPEDFLSTK